MSKPPPLNLAVDARGLSKSYRLGKVDLHVLKEVDLKVRHGEFLSITGSSGSGKSTLLHLVGLLDVPDAGELSINGEDTLRYSAGRRSHHRCEEIGFVFQFYHLLPELTVLENVLMPAMVDTPPLGWLSRRTGARKRAKELIDEMGLSGRIGHRPKELSGGERQRVAIARALMNRPKLLLADEPTGNLDTRTGAKIMDVLTRCNQEHNQTIIMVTHDEDLAHQANRYVVLRDGRLVG
ncbi:MAG: ABC transporter ATP-binding protein [Planctomycetota bacterium]